MGRRAEPLIPGRCPESQQTTSRRRPMLVASRQRSTCPGDSPGRNASMVDGLWGAANCTPLSPCAQAGALMDNGKAGWGASPPPQPAEASPSERWSQAWAENFPGAAAPGAGVSPPLVATDRSPGSIQPPRPEAAAGPPPRDV